jgi:RND family efflux transporter MFP subunit
MKSYEHQSVDAPGGEGVRRPHKPSSARIALGGMVLLALLCGLLALGILPRIQRGAELAASAKTIERGIVLVSVVKPHRAPAGVDILLPGSMQAIEEASIYARANGYLRRRLVDIGDRVRQGQLLAELDSPETDQELRQARADQARAEAALAQARANLAQSNANLSFARVTAERFKNLEKDGVVAHQEADDKQTVLNARTADVDAMGAAITAAQSAIVSSQANVQRLQELQSFEKVTAPFDGVITERNTERGDLIASGSGTAAKPLYKIARADTLRIFIEVPQANVGSVRVGQPAQVRVQEMPNRVFSGKVVRTANALEQATRTLLTEIHVNNADYKLMPGMYAQVTLGIHRAEPPLIVPANTLVIRSEGPRIAVVGADSKVHYQKVQLGRDYGAQVEILSGLEGSEALVVNATDDLREGAPVEVK